MSKINKKDDYKMVHVQDRPWSYSEIEYWRNPADGCINAVVDFDGRRSRLRAGIIIVKDDTILLGEEKGQEGEFSIPGGGLDENESPVEAAVREAKEEVYINVTGAIDTYYDYCECHTEVEKWVKDNVPERKWWYNYYTCLVISRYESDYTGKVKDVDKDLTMNGTSRWYKIKDVIDKPGFKKEWKNALIDYGFYKEYLNESLEESIHIKEDNIKKPENGNIYIVGFQASGKSTLAKKLANKFNFKLVSLDNFDSYNNALEGFYKEWLNKYYKSGDLYEQFIKWSNKQSGYIIEGVQLWDLTDLIDLKKHTFIFIDKDKNTILDQGWERDGGGDFWINDKKVNTKDEYSSILDKEIDIINKSYADNLRNDDNVYVLTDSLVEEYLDDNKEMYTTESVYEVVNRMKQSRTGLRIIWDRHLDRYFICDVDSWIHRDLIDKAVELGYYYHINRWDLDNYLDDYGRNVIYYIYAPKGLEDEIYGSKVSEDGYEGQYVYDFGTVTTRSDSRYKSSPLAKALGKYKAHYIWDGWIDDYTPRIKQVESLTEATRNQLISTSRNADPYKNQKYGKNRFERKRLSKVATQVKSYNQLDMNQFFKQNTLEIKVPVTGETNSYMVSIQMEGVVDEIAKNIKSNNNKLEFKTILQALTKMFNTSNVKVKCTCPDYLYNYDHWLITSGDSVNDTAHDPGPGTTGKDPKGKGCKHILLVLSNQDFLMKVASVIHNYINYAQEHMQKAFLKVIFPKLYGIPASAAEEEGLVPEDTNLETEKHIIDVINEYGKNRGRYTKGTNKNPVTGTGGRAKKEPEKEPDKEKK